MFEKPDSYTPDPKPDKITIPTIQLVLLGAILIGYPTLSTIMNYISPPDKIEVESRIWQIYVPALIFQAFIFTTVIMAVLLAPLRQAGRYFNPRENISSIGLKRADFNWLNLVIGVGFLFAAIIFLNILSNIIGYYGLFQSEDISYLLPRTPLERIFWIALSISAGVAEELCFRGFVITRLTMFTGSIWPGVLIGSLSFGIGHLYQGWAGVVMIGIYGVMFSLLFVARGSLVPCIIAHMLQDILAAFAM